MRKNFGVKSWFYPQPVLIIATYDENGNPDAMNAAWGGISEASEISVCISEGHKTTANILARKAFTISMATAEQLAACDYVGIVSANDVPDKLEKAGLSDAAKQIREGVSDFQKGNMRLGPALTLVKEHLKEA